MMVACRGQSDFESVGSIPLLSHPFPVLYGGSQAYSKPTLSSGRSVTSDPDRHPRAGGCRPPGS